MQVRLNILKNNNIKKGLGMLAIFVCFIILQLTVRRSFGIFEIAWYSHFGINATEFGFARSVGSIGYGAMQIPLGMLLDRFGARCIGGGAVIVFTIGLFMLTWASSWEQAIFAQILLGIGSSGSFISSCKVVINWFDAKLFSFIIGMIMMIGMICMTLGGILTANLMKSQALLAIFPFNLTSNWQNILLIYGIMGLIIAILIFTFIDNANNEQVSNEKWSLKAFKGVISNPNLILLAIVNTLMVGPFSFAISYQDGFFVRVYGFDLSLAAQMTGFLLIGFGLFTPIVTLLGERFGNRNSVSFICIVMAITTALMSYQLVGTNTYFLTAVVLILGASCSYQVLVLNMAVNSVPSTYSTTAFGIVQFANMSLGEGLFPLIFGYLLDYHTKGRAMASSVLSYNASDYQYAMLVILLGCMLAFIALMFIKSNNCSREL